jgi:hypothetical protein
MPASRTARRTGGSAQAARQARAGPGRRLRPGRDPSPLSGQPSPATSSGTAPTRAGPERLLLPTTGLPAYLRAVNRPWRSDQRILTAGRGNGGLDLSGEPAAVRRARRRGGLLAGLVEYPAVPRPDRAERPNSPPRPSARPQRKARRRSACSAATPSCGCAPNTGSASTGSRRPSSSSRPQRAPTDPAATTPRKHPP